MTTTSVLPGNSVVDRVFGAILEPQTWRNLLYLLISFPLGTFYFVAVVTLFSTGVSLLIVFVGVPILILMFMALAAFARLERYLMRNLLGAVLPEPPASRNPPGLIDLMMAWLGRPETWKALVYSLLHFPFGIASFTLVVTLLSVSLGLLAAPLTYALVPLNIGMVPITSFDQAIFCSSAGAVLGLLSLHFLNVWAGLWRRAGTALLS